jgi:DNA-directed RNA polymerase specialized sigma24 family protein
VHWDRATGDRETQHAARGAGSPAAGGLDREPWVCALRAVPYRQREAVVLRHYPGLSGEQAAEAMGISAGAARSHLARRMSSLRRPGPA